eukprot:4829230-Pyramimonas_sp.AAC.1
MPTGPGHQWDCSCGRYVRGHQWACLCGRRYEQRVRGHTLQPGRPHQPQRRDPSRTRREVQRDIQRDQERKEMRQEQEEIKRFLGKVVTMKRSDAVQYMEFIGYDHVPTDIPGIKTYKARTKQRMFEIARLISVARKAGKEDATHYIKEVACLKYMICLLYTSPSPRDRSLS